MPNAELTALIRKGVAALEKGNSLVALVHFEDAARLQQTPVVLSYLAYCLARERRQLQRAMALCSQAVQQEPDNAVHYLNLGRIYLVAGQKARAIQSFRRGLKLGKNPQLLAELKGLGVRKPPVLETLPRSHPLNKFLGLMLGKLGLR